MVGHGGPQQAPLAIAPTGSKIAASIRGWRIVLVACALALSGLGVVARPVCGQEDIDIRLRITWGEGGQRHWGGRFQLSSGTFSEIRRLGFEANAATSIVNDGPVLQLFQPSPVTFDGIDVRVRAAADAELTIQLQPDGQRESETSLQFPLQDFIDQRGHQVETRLDEQGNRLLVRRAPGDHLRFTSARDNLIFAPQGVWEFTLQPHRLGIAAGTKLVCSLELVNTLDGSEHWSQQHSLVTDQSGSTTDIGPLKVQLPANEGCYELVASLRERSFNGALFQGTLLMQRKVQCVVIDSQRQRFAGGEWQELNPSAAKWYDWKRLKQLWPNSKPDPINYGKVGVRQHVGQALVELGVDSWHATPLQIARPGIPHLVEIEYPSDVPQTLGISVLESDAAGSPLPLHIDSGVDVLPLPPAGTAETQRHRILFWPRTQTPWLVLSNRRENRPAVFGKIRVLAGPTHLPPATIAARNDGRMLAAYFDRPLFAENFSAPEALDPVPNRSLEDWNTFYEGGQRLVDYLKHVGYNAAILSVARDGGTVYPTELLDTTPRYDSGVVFLSGQDPQQKDVLELLFRLFDREEMQLVPAIHLANRLPELEARLRQRRADNTGIEMVGADGRPWVAHFAPYRGQAPYYNPLDPRVQTAIQNVVNEIVDRYSHHPSFAGVSLQLGPYTFAQLPGTVWGNDDRTAARFKADTKAEIPIDGGPDRFAERTSFIAGTGRKLWLDWRAKKLGEFYRELQQDLSRTRPDAKLYLAAEELATSGPVRRELHPRLPGKVDFADALLQHGLDPDQIDQAPGIVMMRPQRLKPVLAIADEGANLTLLNSDAVDRLFQQRKTTGALRYHEPVSFILPSFEQSSPFGATETLTAFTANISPNGLHNRASFIHSLATQDARVVVEGGRMLPLGQEDSLRRHFQAFRLLPDEDFTTVTPASTETKASSLVVRTLSRGARTYYYILNDSPWPVSADVQLEMPPRALLYRFAAAQPEPLRFIDGARSWTLALESYDLVAGYIDSPDARVVDWRTTYAPAIQQELEAVVQDVTSRVDKLRKKTPLGVVPNAGFEERGPNGTIAGWQAAQERGVTIDLDGEDPHKGQSSLHMRVEGAKQIAWVRSKPFAPPKTGRISVLAWIRTANQQQQPPLRMAVDDGHGYYHFAPLGIDVDRNLRPTQNRAEQLKADWPRQPYMFHLDDVPAQGIDELMIGFDLMGQGEVWIDEVQVYDRYFFTNEVNELLKNVANADFHLDNGRIADCERFLEGYWPRYLMEHVSQTRLAQAPITPAAPPNGNPMPPVEEEPRGIQRFIPRLPKVKLPFSSDRE